MTIAHTRKFKVKVVAQKHKLFLSLSLTRKNIGIMRASGISANRASSTSQLAVGKLEDCVFLSLSLSAAIISRRIKKFFFSILLFTYTIYHYILAIKKRFHAHLARDIACRINTCNAYSCLSFFFFLPVHILLHQSLCQTSFILSLSLSLYRNLHLLWNDNIHVHKIHFTSVFHHLFLTIFLTRKNIYLLFFVCVYIDFLK